MIAAMALLTVLSGCKGQNGKKGKENKDMKTLVVYFSATGNTRSVARKIADVTGADLEEIVPARPYSTKDLDWTNKESRSSVEMNDPEARPRIKDRIGGMRKYGTIYVGFPIWWYTAPRIIDTFMESYDLSGKTVVFFATSGGSTVTRAVGEFREKYPDIDWKPGKTLNNATKDEIREWIETISQ